MNTHDHVSETSHPATIGSYRTVQEIQPTMNKPAHVTNDMLSTLDTIYARNTDTLLLPFWNSYPDLSSEQAYKTVAYWRNLRKV